MTFLAAHAGGHPSGCPHRAGLILKKGKKKKEKKGEKKGKKGKKRRKESDFDRSDAKIATFQRNMKIMLKFHCKFCENPFEKCV